MIYSNGAAVAASASSSPHSSLDRSPHSAARFHHPHLAHHLPNRRSTRKAHPEDTRSEAAASPQSVDEQRRRRLSVDPLIVVDRPPAHEPQPNGPTPPKVHRNSPEDQNRIEENEEEENRRPPEDPKPTQLNRTDDTIKSNSSTPSRPSIRRPEKPQSANPPPLPLSGDEPPPLVPHQSPIFLNSSDYSQHHVAHARTMVHPNQIIYRKMEQLVKQMLSAEDGVPIKTVKSFLSKIPSVFTGQDIVAWILRNADVVDMGDALHLAHMLASHGYIFQIDDHVLTVKNDGTFYRFQTPYFWPSNCWEPENTDYAVYLCKRTMQNKAHLELEDFEAENLAKLQKMFSRKWEFVFMQAEAQYKVDKKRDRLERQILDSQERAFWDVHRPVPGCVNTTEVDFRKLSRSGRPKYSASSTSMINAGAHTAFNPADAAAASSTTLSANAGSPAVFGVAGTSSATGAAQVVRCNTNEENELKSSGSVYNRDYRPYQRPGLRRCTHLQDSLKYEISQLQHRLSKNVLKTSKVIENYLQYYEHRKYFDSFLVNLGSAADPFQSHSNPWVSDTIDFWQHDKTTGDISTRRLKLWEESFEELLCDQLGRETLQKFLDKEYSGENLRFWWEVQKLRTCSNRMVPVLVTEIYSEFIDSNATSPVNIDCKVMEITEENLLNPNRWSFDEAADHIFCLMKNDSYQRFLRSEIYRDLVNLSRKKSSLSALISRKTSRKVPAPRSLSTKSGGTLHGIHHHSSASLAAQHQQQPQPSAHPSTQAIGITQSQSSVTGRDSAVASPDAPFGHSAPSASHFSATPSAALHLSPNTSHSASGPIAARSGAKLSTVTIASLPAHSTSLNEPNAHSQPDTAPPEVANQMKKFGSTDQIGHSVDSKSSSFLQLPST